MGQELIKNMNEELKKIELKGKIITPTEMRDNKFFHTEIGAPQYHKKNDGDGPEPEEESSINIDQRMQMISNVSEIKKDENKSKLIESGINISRFNNQFHSEQKKLLVSFIFIFN